MILAIRISGMISIHRDAQETMYRMRLRRKYAATLIADTPQNRKMLEGVRNFIAYGDISKEMLQELLEKRAEPLKGKKVDVAHVMSQIDKKRLDELGVKPFFRLHPPRGGIESKRHFGTGRGVLGNHKDAIDKLVERML
ncbi:MAG TPA: uL30 family ribosomal protein [Candidatus Nanoarchaeia archaeon]|nr:uL30 family ribosomal protein [Candidatus Nanoarchaeia archaeon]